MPLYSLTGVYLLHRGLVLGDRICKSNKSGSAVLATQQGYVSSGYVKMHALEVI